MLLRHWKKFYNKITEKLATFIGRENVATVVVENQEFRDLLQELHSRYVVNERTVIRTELSKIIKNMKKNISQELIKARKIHLCCDIWSKKLMT